MDSSGRRWPGPRRPASWGRGHHGRAHSRRPFGRPGPLLPYRSPPPRGLRAPARPGQPAVRRHPEPHSPARGANGPSAACRRGERRTALPSPGRPQEASARRHPRPAWPGTPSRRRTGSARPSSSGPRPSGSHSAAHRPGPERAPCAVRPGRPCRPGAAAPAGFARSPQQHRSGGPSPGARYHGRPGVAHLPLALAAQPEPARTRRTGSHRSRPAEDIVPVRQSHHLPVPAAVARTVCPGRAGRAAVPCHPEEISHVQDHHRRRPRGQPDR